MSVTLEARGQAGHGELGEALLKGVKQPVAAGAVGGPGLADVAVVVISPDQ